MEGFDSLRSGVVRDGVASVETSPLMWNQGVLIMHEDVPPPHDLLHLLNLSGEGQQEGIVAPNCI